MKDLLRLPGRKGLSWIAIGSFFSLLFAGTEYAISLLIIVLFSVLNLVEPSALPSWLPFDPAALSPGQVLLLVLAVGVLRAVCQLASSQAGHMVLELVSLRLKLIQGYELLMGQQGRRIPLSRVNLRMGELIPRTSDFVYHGIALFVSAVHATAIAAGMLYFAWREALVGIVCLAVLGLALSRFNRFLASLSGDISRERERLEKTVVRISSNWMLIRALHLQEREHAVYKDSVLGYFRHALKAFLCVNTMVVLPRLTAVVVVALIVIANVALFTTPAVDLIGFFYLFSRFVHALVDASSHLGMMNRCRFHYEACVKLYQSLPEADLKKALEPAGKTGFFRPGAIGAPEGKPGLSAGSFSGETALQAPPEIELRNVTFSWPGISAPLFEELSLRVPAGERLTLVGPNGSGKSTLLGICLGVLAPSSGEAFIGGIPADDYLRSHGAIGYVAADPYLIDETIRGNLLYGNENQVSSAEIMEVLARVRLDRVIGKLPGGLEYRISEKGEGLSSGEKQLLALARAFLRKPVLLVLDEAAANLDTGREAQIAQILDESRGRCTTIVVSKKEGTLIKGDHLLDLNKP